MMVSTPAATAASTRVTPVAYSADSMSEGGPGGEGTVRAKRVCMPCRAEGRLEGMEGSKGWTVMVTPGGVGRERRARAAEEVGSRVRARMVG